MKLTRSISSFLNGYEVHAGSSGVCKFSDYWRLRKTQDVFGNLKECQLKNLRCTSNNKYIMPGEIETEIPPYAVEFCTADGNEDNFAVADENGSISLFSLRSRQSSSKNGSLPLQPIYKLKAHNNAIFDITWVPNERILATASGDQSAALWDLEKGEAIAVFRGHSCSLKSISASKHDKNMFATGSRDGNILIWDKRTSKQLPHHPVLRIQGGHVINDCLTPLRKRRRISMTDAGQLGKDSRQTVSSVIFQNEHTVITAGAMDGTLKIWDLRKLQSAAKLGGKSAHRMLPKETLPYPGSSQRRRGYTCLTMDSTSTQLFASCTDDSIFHFDLSSAVSIRNFRKPVCRYRGHCNTSFYIRTALSPDNNFLLSGSDDNMGYIWRVNRGIETPIIRLVSEGMSEVTAVAWSPNDFSKLVTCSDECAVRVWDIACSEFPSKSMIDGHADALTTNSIHIEDKLPVLSGLKPLAKPTLVESSTILESTNSNSSLDTNIKLHPQKSKRENTTPSIDKWLVRTPPYKKKSVYLNSRVAKTLTMSSYSDKENIYTMESSKMNPISLPKQDSTKTPEQDCNKFSAEAVQRCHRKKIRRPRKTIDAYFKTSGKDSLM